MTIWSSSQFPPRSWYEAKANSKNNTHDGIYKVRHIAKPHVKNLTSFAFNPFLLRGKFLPLLGFFAINRRGGVLEDVLGLEDVLEDTF